MQVHAKALMLIMVCVGVSVRQSDRMSDSADVRILIIVRTG